MRDDGADLTHNAVHTYQLKVHANAQVLTFDPQGTLRADRNNKTVVLKPFAFATATAITGTVRRRAGRTAVVSYNPRHLQHHRRPAQRQPLLCGVLD